MTMEYRMSQGNKAFMYFFAVAFIGGGLLMLYFAVQRQAWPMLFFVPLVGGLGYLFYRLAAKTALTIDDTSITVCNGYNTRSVLLDEVAGWRSGDKNSILLVLKSGERPLTISGMLEQRKEVKNWVEERFTDIAAQLAKEVTEEVLHDERYGLTEEDRARRLKQARKMAGYGTVISPLLFLWVFLDPEPLNFLMIVLLAIPFAAVLLTGYYKGILRLYTTKSKPYPSLIFAVLIAIGAAFFVAATGYNVYRFDSGAWKLLLILTIVVTVVWAAICRTAATGEKNLFAIYTGMLLLAGGYSYSALVFSNCAYDKKKAEIWRVAVDHKHYSSGKYTSYYLDLSAWGNYGEGNSVKVSHTFYRETRPGDSVNVYLHPGKWGIPWYEVRAD
jgi:hypothetical protein